MIILVLYVNDKIDYFISLKYKVRSDLFIFDIYINMLLLFKNNYFIFV